MIIAIIIIISRHYKSSCCTVHARRDNAQVGKQAGPLHDKRPRSPNPNAMPKSLTTTPPLKPTLDPSAKSWVEIAVSQRGSGGSPRSGQRAEGIARNGSQQKQPAAPGAALDGLLCNCASAVAVTCFVCSRDLIPMHHYTCIQATEHSCCELISAVLVSSSLCTDAH